MQRRVIVSKGQRKAWQVQQYALDKPLTVGERFTRVIHAIYTADDETIQRETIYLVRAARAAQLLKEKS